MISEGQFSEITKTHAMYLSQKQLPSIVFQQ